MKKRIAALVLALSLAMGLTGTVVFAADEETGGSCGENVYWEFDESTGTLTIYGTGEMNYGGDDASSDGSEWPWYPYSSDIKSVVIEPGVTAIAIGAFMNYYTSIESVSIPSTVTSIGQSVFAGCISLTDVYYAGTEEQWNEISIDADNTYLLNAAVHYNSTGTDDSDSTDDSISSDDSDASSGTSADAADSEPSASDTSLSIIASETTASYTLGSGGSAVIAVDADIETFVSAAVDGTVLTLDTDYTVTEGSTIITFTESFLETLSEGDHDVVIAFTGGDVETTLSVEASDSSSGSEDADDEADSDDSSAAEVGDASNLALWIALGLLAALGLAGSGLRRRTAR